eukprot:4246084-Amphidinium_carterae.1
MLISLSAELNLVAALSGRMSAECSLFVQELKRILAEHGANVVAEVPCLHAEGKEWTATI